MNQHKEIAFEKELAEHLAANGWLYSADDTGYDRERALFPEDVLGWLADTQPDQLEKVVKPGGGDIVKQQSQLLDRIVKVLDTPMDNGGGTLNLLRKDAESKTVYVVQSEGRTVGTFTISTQRPDYYSEDVLASLWGKSLYISRLAILPEMQGRGIGTWCMRWIERAAWDMDCVAVRLDVVVTNTKLLGYYGRLGYKETGRIDFCNCCHAEAILLEKAGILNHHIGTINCRSRQRHVNGFATTVFLYSKRH